MRSNATAQFAVVGAGLGGALMALYLGQAGHEVEVLERRPDPRAGTPVKGRSINLAISTRGLHALHEVGLTNEMMTAAVPMRGRMMHALDGRLTFQRYGTRHEHVINSVSRGGLNRMLVDAADRLPNVAFHFSRHVRDVDLDGGGLTVTDGRTGKTSEMRAEVIVGADGAFSAVRARMQRLDRFNYQQAYLEHGYKELTIPAADEGGYRMEPNALHIWPRGGFMMIALPNCDGSFTCTLFWPFDGPSGLRSLRDEASVVRFFKTHFADAESLMPTLAGDYLENPDSSLVTIRSGPWNYRDRVVLLGDACHAVVPFYGQGANAAFEDCTVLAECLRRHGSDRQVAFQDYYQQRKIQVDALADLAIANFVEMRDRVASPTFLMRKRLERGLHRIWPAGFVPLYSMVTFSRIPYAEAVRRAKRQATVLRFGAMVILILIATVALWS